MYNISATNNQSGQNKVGELGNQIFDTSQQVAAANQQAAQAAMANRASREKKLAEDRKKTSDLMNNQVGIVHPSDIPAFQQKTADYRQKVLEATKRGMTIEDESALNQEWNNITQQSLASAKRADAERASLAKFDNPNEFYRQGEHEAAHKNFQQSSFNPDGSYNFEPKVNPVAKYDIDKDVKALAAEVRQNVNTNEVNRVKGIPVEQSVGYARSFGEDPRIQKDLHGQMTEMNHDGVYQKFIGDVYGNPKTSTGVANPSYIADPKKREEKIAKVSSNPDNLGIDDYKDITGYEHVDKFLFRGVSPAPKGPYIGPGSTPYKGTVAAVYNEKTGDLTTRTGTTGEKELESDVIIGDKSVRIEPPTVKFKPGTNEIVGGSYTVVPTEEERTTNTANRAINKDRAKTLEQQLRRNPKPEPKMFESQATYNKRYLDWVQKNDRLKEEYAPEPIVETKTVKTDDPELIRRLYFETWKKYPEDVVSGSDREGVKFGLAAGKGDSQVGKKPQDEVDNKAKEDLTSTQKDAIEAFKEQLKREPTEKEMQGILNKYK